MSPFYVDVLFPVALPILFPDLTIYDGGCLIRNMNCLSSPATEGTSGLVMRFELCQHSPITSLFLTLFKNIRRPIFFDKNIN